MESRDETQPRGLSEARRKLIRETIEKIEADNARLCAERNARRWKDERDPEEYERQKAHQRSQYADARDGSVRPYEKIEAATKTEHKEKAQARDATRQKKHYDGMSPAERQAKSDRTADAAWCARRRAEGMSEDQIQAALDTRIIERNAKRVAKEQEAAEDAAMRALPTFGIV